jgi:hypothetical protein
MQLFEGNVRLRTKHTPKLILLMFIAKNGSVERDVFERDHVCEGIQIDEARARLRVIAIWEMFFTRWWAALKRELDDTLCE